MSTIKRFNLGFILLLTLMALFSTNLFGQQGQRKEQVPRQLPNEAQINKMVEDLSVELSLNETQKTKILLLYTDHFAEVKASMNDKRPSRAEMEGLKEEFENDVKILLNDEQQDLFDEYIEKKQKQNKQKANKVIFRKFRFVN